MDYYIPSFADRVWLLYNVTLKAPVPKFWKMNFQYIYGHFSNQCIIHGVKIAIENNVYAIYYEMVETTLSNFREGFALITPN